MLKNTGAYSSGKVPCVLRVTEKVQRIALISQKAFVVSKKQSVISNLQVQGNKIRNPKPSCHFTSEEYEQIKLLCRNVLKRLILTTFF